MQAERGKPSCTRRSSFSKFCSDTTDESSAHDPDAVRRSLLLSNVRLDGRPSAAADAPAAPAATMLSTCEQWFQQKQANNNNNNNNKK